MSLVEFGVLTSADAGRLDATAAVGLIHLGSVEQHGPHLPLVTDAMFGEALGRAIAERVVTPVVVAPRIPVGLSDHHLGFAGTVSVSPEVMTGLINAYISAVRRLGVTRIGVFSAHGGNFGLLEELEHQPARALDVDLAMFHDLATFLDVMMQAGRRAGLEPFETDIHAGVLETSVALHLFPELVEPFGGVDGYVQCEPGWRQRLWQKGTDSLSETGVLGNPRGANADAGAVIFEALVELLSTWLADRFTLNLMSAGAERVLKSC